MGCCERAVHRHDLEQRAACRVVSQLQPGARCVDGGGDLAAGCGVDGRQDLADGRGAVDADTVDGTVADLDLEVVQVGRLRGLEAELRDRLVGCSRRDGEAVDHRHLGTEGHLVADVAGLELVAQACGLQRLIDVDHQIEDVAVGLGRCRRDGDRHRRAAIEGDLEHHVGRGARQRRRQHTATNGRGRCQAGIGHRVDDGLCLEAELGCRRIGAGRREREPGHAGLADEFDPALVGLRLHLAAETGRHQCGVQVGGQVGHRQVGGRAGRRDGDRDRRAAIDAEVEVGVCGEPPVDRVGHQRGRCLDRHAVVVVQLLQRRRRRDRLARVCRPQVGAEGHSQAAGGADDDGAVAVDVEQRAQVEFEIDRQIQVDEVMRQLDRVAQDLGRRVVVRVDQARVQAQDVRQQGGELVGRPEIGRVVGLQQLRDVVADLDVVRGRRLCQQHLGDGGHAGPGDADRKARVARQLAVGRSVGARDDGEPEADGRRSLRRAEPELGQTTGVAGARCDLEGRDSGVLGNQADAPVAAFGADHPVEPCVGQRLVDVGDQGVCAVHLVVAVVDQQAVGEHVAEGEHAVEGAADKGNLEVREEVAVLQLVQRGRQLPEQADEAGRIQVVEVEDVAQPGRRLHRQGGRIIQVGERHRQGRRR